MKMNPLSTFASAVLPLLFVLLVLGPLSLAFGQETHPGGTWGAWLTLPQYPKLQMRVKCEYWVTDPSDNNRAHSLWAIQYRSNYAQPMDVVQANTYYDMIVKRNKNWDAPGQFTLQPGQTRDYGETTVLGACPKSGGASPINLAVYCVVPSGQADQSASCQAHGVPKKMEPGSATASRSSTPTGGGRAETQAPKEYIAFCINDDANASGWTVYFTDVFTTTKNMQELTEAFGTYLKERYPSITQSIPNCVYRGGPSVDPSSLREDRKQECERSKRQECIETHWKD